MINVLIDNSLSQDKESSPLFTMADVLNVRLYYKAASTSLSNNGSPFTTSVWIDMKDDPSALRTRLHSVLQWKSRHCRYRSNVDREIAPVIIPAHTAVPVLDMCPSYGSEAPTKDACMPLMAMQVMLVPVDMARMEMDMWAWHNHT